MFDFNDSVLCCYGLRVFVKIGGWGRVVLFG